MISVHFEMKWTFRPWVASKNGCMSTFASTWTKKSASFGSEQINLLRCGASVCADIRKAMLIIYVAKITLNVGSSK